MHLKKFNATNERIKNVSLGELLSLIISRIQKNKNTSVVLLSCFSGHF